MAEREQPPSFENGEDIRERTFAFGCAVARYCETLRVAGGNGLVLAPQLLRCSTAVASMLEEARAAESRADFISKCAIALKEARESYVRLRTCQALRYGQQQTTALVDEANQIVAILMSILRNTRRNSRERVRIPNS